MKTEVIIVPKEQNPLRVLKELEERMKNAWLFLHKSVKKELIDNNKNFKYWAADTGFMMPEWMWCYVIESYDFPVKLDCTCKNPECIFFIKMEE